MVFLFIHSDAVSTTSWHQRCICTVSFLVNTTAWLLWSTFLFMRILVWSQRNTLCLSLLSAIYAFGPVWTM